LTTENKAWVKVRQFHVDRYVQEVRFYHLRDGQWRRTDFDPSFWSGLTETSDTPHFRFTYYIEDYDLIEPIASLLEADYDQICLDLACPTAPETCVEALGQQWCSSFPREITTTFKMTGQTERQDNFDIAPNGDLTFTMASLRYLDQVAPFGQEQSLRNPIAWLHMMRLAYGHVDFQGPPPQGRSLVIAIFFHEYDQLLKRTGDQPTDVPAEFKQLDVQNLPPLDSVWIATDANDTSQTYATAYAIVEYIDQKFGRESVARLLKAIGPSKSLVIAIETSTGVSYVAFEKQWRAWVAANASTAP
jgi:hypothetical protein